MGSSPITIYIESAAGIKEGARTGLASLMIMFCFIIALFFTPLIAAIPPFATGPALILVGSMMIINITTINWGNVQESVPAFLTIAVMPLTYSIAYGVIAGIMSYIILNGSVFCWNLVQAKFFPNSVPDSIALECQGNLVQTARKWTFDPPAEQTTVIPHEDFSAHPGKAKPSPEGSMSKESV